MQSKAKIKEKGSAVTCHRHLSLRQRGKDKKDNAVPMHLSPVNYILASRIITIGVSIFSLLNLAQSKFA